jgi:hypothetical protein
MKLRIHIAAATLSLLVIAAFMATALAYELAPDHFPNARRYIAWGLLLLVPALIATGATGHQLARGATRGLVGDKLARMKVVAINGMCILVPAALWLAWRAGAGETGGIFSFVQLVEFAAGMFNLALLAANFRDGLRLSGRWRRRPLASVTVLGASRGQAASRLARPT